MGFERGSSFFHGCFSARGIFLFFCCLSPVASLLFKEPLLTLQILFSSETRLGGKTAHSESPLFAHYFLRKEEVNKSPNQWTAAAQADVTSTWAACGLFRAALWL